MSVKVTRLRSIRTRTIDELEQIINALPFKIEIKSGPLPFKDTKGTGWMISFVLPEIEQIKWVSVDTR